MDDTNPGPDASGSYHAAVMVAEVLEYLRPERGGTYFDGTLGGGGHSAAILERAPAAHVIGVDQDPEAHAVAARTLDRYRDRVELRHANFAEAAAASPPLAGALLDLGVSSHQLDAAGRGFSFRRGTPLDMRMDPSAAVATAADLLNTLSEAELADVFYRYGEERRSRRLAAALVRRRARTPYRTSDDLMAAIDSAFGRRLEVSDRARLFQALRIAVNAELDMLERALPVLRDRLASAGIFVVLSYHSLEDRAVKTAFREWSRACVCPPELLLCQCRGHALGEVLTRRPVRASEAEVSRNPRARAARLRAWQKAA